MPCDTICTSDMLAFPTSEQAQYGDCLRQPVMGLQHREAENRFVVPGAPISKDVAHPSLARMMRAILLHYEQGAMQQLRR